MIGSKSTIPLQKHLISAYPNIISEIDIHTGKYLSSKVDSHKNEMLVLGILLSVMQQKGQVAMRISELIEKSFGEHLDTISSNIVDYDNEVPSSNYFLVSGTSTELGDTENKTTHTGVLSTKLTKEVLDGFVGCGIIGDPDRSNFITIEIEFPLVRQGEWVYLSRYWEAERTIMTSILHRLAINDSSHEQTTKNPDEINAQKPVLTVVNQKVGSDVDITNFNSSSNRILSVKNSLNFSIEPKIHERIQQYLHDDEGRTESQIKAVKTAIKNRFAIITGGPGTGKTRCITTLLAALFEFNPTLKAALAAPTGKAAARMMESVSQNLDALKIPESILQCIPKSASTLHRLIGWNPGLGRAKYSKDRRLELDLLIIDEASMVDLAMLARVFKALPDTCRIILLGDKDQLSSVEAGAVFGEITKTIAGLQTNSRKSSDGNKPESAEISAKSDSKYDFMVSLSHSWRFSDQSKLSELADLINQGDDVNSWQLMKNEGSLGVVNPKQTKLIDIIISRIDDVHNQLLNQIEMYTKGEYGRGDSNETSPNAVNSEKSFRIDGELFATLKSYQILSAHRRGYGGSMMLNAVLDKKLSEKLRKMGRQSHISGDGEWYVGRPVIVTQNDYNLGLFNGDVGITIKLNNRLMVSFGVDPKTNRLKIVAPSQLYNIESAWVITVHKSQGSEFDNIMVVLPDEISPVLTRELIYTAVTRARNRVEIYGHESVWHEAVQKQTGRYSGIGEMLTQLLDA